MTQPRFHPPPPPSTPREAPWREIEEIIDLLKTVAQRLAGVSTGTLPSPIIPPTILPPAPAELRPITDRLDLLIYLYQNHATFITGQKLVTTAGKPESMDALEILPGCRLTIMGRADNTKNVYFSTQAAIGDTNRRFDSLAPGIAHSLRIQDASKVWLDVDVSGEGISYYTEQDR